MILVLSCCSCTFPSWVVIGNCLSMSLVLTNIKFTWYFLRAGEFNILLVVVEQAGAPVSSLSPTALHPTCQWGNPLLSLCCRLESDQLLYQNNNSLFCCREITLTYGGKPWLLSAPVTTGVAKSTRTQMFAIFIVSLKYLTALFRLRCFVTGSHKDSKS